jgi:Fe-S-cluster formation regulator IscX/YfhJ
VLRENAFPESGGRRLSVAVSDDGQRSPRTSRFTDHHGKPQCAVPDIADDRQTGGEEPSGDVGFQSVSGSTTVRCGLR